MPPHTWHRQGYDCTLLDRYQGNLSQAQHRTAVWSQRIAGPAAHKKAATVRAKAAAVPIKQFDVGGMLISLVVVRGPGYFFSGAKPGPTNSQTTRLVANYNAASLERPLS